MLHLTQALTLAFTLPRALTLTLTLTLTPTLTRWQCYIAFPIYSLALPISSLIDCKVGQG